MTKAFLSALSPSPNTIGKRNADQLEEEKDEDDEDDIQHALDNIDPMDTNNSNNNAEDDDDDDDDSPHGKSKALRTLLLKIRGLVAKVRKSPQAKVYFRQCCSQTDNNTKAKELIPFCKTRWETWENVMGRLVDLKRVCAMHDHILLLTQTFYRQLIYLLQQRMTQRVFRKLGGGSAPTLHTNSRASSGI